MKASIYTGANGSVANPGNLSTFDRWSSWVEISVDGTASLRLVRLVKEGVTLGVVASYDVKECDAEASDGVVSGFLFATSCYGTGTSACLTDETVKIATEGEWLADDI